MALPTIDLSTIIKLSLRKVVRATVKTSVGMLILLCGLVSALVAVLVGFFTDGILPELSELITLQISYDGISGFVETILYAIDYATMLQLLSYFYRAMDSVIVFTISFMITAFGALMTYHWCRAFREDCWAVFGTT